MNNFSKSPRLYTLSPLAQDTTVSIGQDQTHYLRNVLRLNEGDSLRVFNGMHGEWLTTINTQSKKETLLLCHTRIKDQPSPPKAVYLLFSPIKKQRLDMLIEKAVELGATHLYPVITDHTENRHLKEERIKTQIIEAAEQCERMDIPALLPPQQLRKIIPQWHHTDAILWAAERDSKAIELLPTKAPAAILIGPEGGFSQDECEFLASTPHVTPVSLGSRILRAETAVFYALAHIKT